jgi:CheY-like chemotaxis protein
MESLSVHGKSLRFLIADDHAIFADALRAFLEKTHTVVGLVRDGHAMVTEAIRLQPDVIVVDVGMPLLNGLDAARKINVQAPNIKFVFLTMRDDPNLAAGSRTRPNRVCAETLARTRAAKGDRPSLAWQVLSNAQAESWRLG